MTEAKSKICLVSLGCARNLVDSELMLGRLAQAGYDVSDNPGTADIIIINTCSFISSAVDESIDTVLILAKNKRSGNCRQLIVTGCLPERFGEALAESMPEVDCFLGTGAYHRIVDAAAGNIAQSRCLLPSPENSPLQNSQAFRIRTSPHMAYVKIAEGCNKKCTFCMIPQLRGGLRSREESDIIAEAVSLKQTGVKEIVLVAQDTTCYGQDLVPAKKLDGLLERLANRLDGIWLRWLYGHPESVDATVMHTVARHDNLCSYFDLPIQHASNRLLKRMGRRYSRDALRQLFLGIRSSIPDAALRTTVLVGFPGETDEDFQTLLEFVKEIRFDHLGVFTYSDADELTSHRFLHHVDREVAEARYHHLMTCQADISRENNRKHVGRRYQVLVENRTENGYYIGRTEFQAPEVDGMTIVRSNDVTEGEFIVVQIKEAGVYDLEGVPVR